MDIYRAVS